MKLLYSKAACSLAPHIVLEELGLPHELVLTDIRLPPTTEFLQLNPMGAVPVLVLDDGQALTEISAILQYLVYLKPSAGLAPIAGTFERIRLQEWLNFIASEIHKGFGPLWGADDLTSNPDAQEEIRAYARKDLFRKFNVIVNKLGDRPYLMGEYTVADAYLFTVLNWTAYLKMDLSPWPTLVRYQARVRERPATERAFKAERLR